MYSLRNCCLETDGIFLETILWDFHRWECILSFFMFFVDISFIEKYHVTIENVYIEESGNTCQNLSIERMPKIEDTRYVYVHRFRANILKGMVVDKVGCGTREGCRVTRGFRPSKSQGIRHPTMEHEANERLHLDEKSIFTAVRTVPRTVVPMRSI